MEAVSAALWSLAVDQALLSSGYLGVYCRWRGLDLFPTATQIVAWYPACQQLAQAVNLRFPDSPAEAQVWLKDLKNHWWQGEVKTIIAPLQAAGMVGNQNQHFTPAFFGGDFERV